MSAISLLLSRIDRVLTPLDRFFRRHQKIVKNILLVLSVLSLGVFFTSASAQFSLANTCGSLAWFLLLLVGVVGPLARITRMRIMGLGVLLRRELGILMGVLAIVHSGILMGLSDGSFSGGLFAGFIALVLSTILLVTSNAFSQKLLGRYWRYTHLSVIVIVPLVFVHIAMMTGHYSDIIWVILFILIRGADMADYRLPPAPVSA